MFSVISNERMETKEAIETMVCLDFEPVPTAEIGTSVTIRINGGKPERFLLVDGDEVLTRTSPIGRALLGASAGERFSVMQPGGRAASVEVVGIE